METGTMDRAGLAARLSLQARRLESLAEVLTAKSRALPRAKTEGWRGPAHAAFERDLAAFEREIRAVIDRVRAAEAATRQALSAVSANG